MVFCWVDSELNEFRKYWDNIPVAKRDQYFLVINGNTRTYMLQHGCVCLLLLAFVFCLCRCSFHYTINGVAHFYPADLTQQWLCDVYTPVQGKEFMSVTEVRKLAEIENDDGEQTSKIDLVAALQRIREFVFCLFLSVFCDYFFIA